MPAPSKLPPIVVVIVEDSDEDFDTVEEAVRHAGINAEVRRAPTGGDGLDLLRGRRRSARRSS